MVSYSDTLGFIKKYKKEKYYIVLYLEYNVVFPQLICAHSVYSDVDTKTTAW